MTQNVKSFLKSLAKLCDKEGIKLDELVFTDRRAEQWKPYTLYKHDTYAGHARIPEADKRTTRLTVVDTCYRDIVK